MPPADLSLVRGLPEQMRNAVVRLFHEAFSAKLQLAIPNEEARFGLLNSTFQLEHAIGAVADGELLGFAGIRTSDESMARGVTYRSLRRDLGFFPGLRASFVFALFERDAARGELILEFLSVGSAYRGEGVGSQLLEQVETMAIERGFDRISLEVIDTNPGARRLYERHGYRETKRKSFKWLEGVLGFGAVSVMTRNLSPEQ